MKFIKYSLFAYIALMASCIKDNPDENTTDKVVTSDNGVYILNEGNYLFGNASVSYYDADKSTLQEDIFNGANKRALGDVAQSMTIANNKAYVVVNNSGKI